jgi:hypothetical protein
MTKMLPADVHATFVACAAVRPHVGTEDDRRAATRFAVETIRARHGLNWICKTEHETGWASASKDAIGDAGVPVYPADTGKRMKVFLWDMVNGETRQVLPAHESEEQRWTYALVPDAIDHLAGGGPGPVVPGPVEPGPDAGLEAIKGRLVALEAAHADLAVVVQQQSAALKAMEQKAAALVEELNRVKTTTYSGTARVFGFNVPITVKANL